MLNETFFVTWNFVQHLEGHPGGEFTLVLHDEPAQGHLDRGRQTCREQIG